MVGVGCCWEQTTVPRRGTEHTQDAVQLGQSEASMDTYLESGWVECEGILEDVGVVVGGGDVQ